jgi:hypothetical protein
VSPARGDGKEPARAEIGNRSYESLDDQGNAQDRGKVGWENDANEIESIKLICAETILSYRYAFGANLLRERAGDDKAVAGAREPEDCYS